MIVREVKLKLTKRQETMLNHWIWNLSGIYNFGIKEIKRGTKRTQDATELQKQIDKITGVGIYTSKLDLQNSLAGVSNKIGIPSHVIQGTLVQSYIAWERCFNKISKKPIFKGKRNKLTSIPFPDPIKSPIENKIKLLGLKEVRFFKQALPEGKIKRGRIVKRSSGWYLQLTIDAIHVFPVSQTNDAVAIDPGFSTLLTLWNGIEAEKIENPRELRERESRLGQAQRGHNKKLASRLHERQANIRKDRNHKISRNLLERYKTIYWSNDSFKNMSKLHGKSVTEAGLGQIRDFLTYKSQFLADREVILVSNVNSTKRCSSCKSLTGPSGMKNLAVRDWVCEVCGTHHDRDINAGMNTYNVGAGCAHEVPVMEQLTEKETNFSINEAICS